MKLAPFVLIILAVSFYSCSKKSDPDVLNSKPSKSQNLPSISQNTVTNSFFDWESAEKMPVHSSVPEANIPRMPWHSQTGTPISPYIVNDYKKENGWVMVYNTFNNTVFPYHNTVPPGGLYFAIYNIYRGLLRFYTYIPPGYISQNSQIENGLKIYTSNNSSSKLLNFESDIVDPLGYATEISKVNSVAISSSGGWYAMQYEIAYDPSFASTIYPSLGITWNSKAVNITRIELDGTQTGVISGSIVKKTSGFDLNGNLSTISGALGEFLGKEPYLPVKILKSISSVLSGATKDFFSAIWGGQASSEQVNLKLKTNVALQGTMISSQPLVPNNFVFPGQNTNNSIGAPLPMYNKLLGVFNLTSRPIIRLSHSNVPSTGGNNPTVKTNFRVETGSVNLIVNPSVTEKAIVSIESIEGLLPATLNRPPFSVASMASGFQIEEIGQSSYLTIISTNSYFLGYDELLTGQGAVVRIKVKIVPKDGSAPSYIVKTFSADLML